MFFYNRSLIHLGYLASRILVYPNYAKDAKNKLCPLISPRDKLNLDILWIKDKSLEDAESLPEPDVLAQEIADDLLAAMEQFAATANELRE